jgi:ketosteroid isomerase-like protein
VREQAAAVPMSAGTVARYACAWQEGDLATLVDCYDDDVVVHYGGRSAFAGTHVGRDRLMAVLLETASRGARRLVSIDQLHDDGDAGALFVTESFVVDGATVTVPRALRYRLAAGRFVECWLYDHEQHLVDQAWSQPRSA